MTGQSRGNGSDFNMALMKLKDLTTEDLFRLYFDYACRLVTWDLEACKPYRDLYIGDFDYRCVLTEDTAYQVALASCPQGTGFNVIPLELPAPGTRVVTHLTGLPTGSPLLDADPGEYLNGDSQFATAPRRNYNSVSQRSSRGFRMGYVALMEDGTRRYFSDDKVYCQGTARVTEDYAMTMPEGVSKLWLVVSPALKNYIKHKWDDNINADDMWPYQVKFEGTDIGNRALVYAAPTLDKRKIADATFTYDVTFPVDANGYSGAVVTISGRAAATLGTAFQLQPTSIADKMQAWSSQGPANNKIMFYAVNADGSFVQRGSTANGYGHWFNANGQVSDYASGYVFSEFYPTQLAFQLGQYPGKNSNGKTYTIRQALRYRKNASEQATATFVFNITVGPSQSLSLRSIDYTDPTADAIEVLPASPSVSPDVYYDLQGHRVSTPTSGIYLYKGKKVVK
jgi:hypothetical protein